MFVCVKPQWGFTFRKRPLHLNTILYIFPKIYLLRAILLLPHILCHRWGCQTAKGKTYTYLYLIHN
ncbi:Uncharacterised protein [Segatella copri]|nr:Uncharacterised protein [Segatella copri]